MADKWRITVKAMSASVAKATKKRREDSSDSGDDPAFADLLIQLGQEETELFQNEDGNEFATIKNEAGGRITIPLNSTRFEKHLLLKFYDATGRGAAGECVRTAMSTLTAIANRGPKRPVYIRVAAVGMGTVIDIGDDSGRVIEVKGGTWRIVDHSPVPFYRPDKLSALPVPVRGGSLRPLRNPCTSPRAPKAIEGFAWLWPGYYAP